MTEEGGVQFNLCGLKQILVPGNWGWNILLTAAIFACKLGGMGVAPPGRPRRPVSVFFGVGGAILLDKGVGLGLWRS